MKSSLQMKSSLCEGERCEARGCAPLHSLFWGDRRRRWVRLRYANNPSASLCSAPRFIQGRILPRPPLSKKGRWCLARYPGSCKWSQLPQPRHFTASGDGRCKAPLAFQKVTLYEREKTQSNLLRDYCTTAKVTCQVTFWDFFERYCILGDFVLQLFCRKISK